MPNIGNGHALGPSRHPCGSYQMNEPQKFLMQSGLGHCLSIWSLCNSRVHGGEIKTKENMAKSEKRCQI